MSFGPESHNPRERRAFAHAAISSYRRTGNYYDYDKATNAIEKVGDSRKARDSRFYDHLTGAQGKVSERSWLEWDTHVKAVFADYTADPTSRLSTDLMLFSALRPEHPQAPKINRDVATIHGLMKKFETSVWFKGGLQTQVLGTRERGLAFRQNDLSALVYSLAGRTLITLEDAEKDATVTFITADTEKEHRMGIQSIDATAPDAVALIGQMMEMNRDGKMQFSPDENVSLF